MQPGVPVPGLPAAEGRAHKGEFWQGRGLLPPLLTPVVALFRLMSLGFAWCRVLASAVEGCACRESRRALRYAKLVASGRICLEKEKSWIVPPGIVSQAQKDVN